MALQLPQQELFSRVLVDLRELFEKQGIKVYDGALPPEGTDYPFVYMGDFRQDDTANKSAVFGTVYATVHVWHCNPQKRGTVSKMLMEIIYACRDIDKTDNRKWHVSGMNNRIITDNTTKTPLLHGIVEATFRFS